MVKPSPQTNLRLTLRCRESLQALAEEDKRTLASEVEWLIERELKRRHRLKQELGADPDDED